MDNAERSCIIVGAGEFGGLVRPIETGKDFVIAADGGYRYLRNMGICPDMWVGDADSLGGIPEDSYEGAVIELPREKDETDMLYACNYALENGFRSFQLYGALGGRLDHTLANIKILSYLADRGAAAYCYGISEMLTVISDGGISFPKEAVGIISVFSLSEESVGVTIKGLKYEVGDIKISESDSIGVSNEFIGCESYIEVKKGKLLIVIS